MRPVRGIGIRACRLAPADGGGFAGSEVWFGEFLGMTTCGDHLFFGFNINEAILLEINR